MIPIRSLSRLPPLAAAACVGLLLTASGRAAAGSDPPGEVRISDYKFQPSTITVSRGATVKWVNEDEDPHTVTADGGAFASRGIEKKEEFTFTFSTPGSFKYHCALHPKMTGTVVVQ